MDAHADAVARAKAIAARLAGTSSSSSSAMIPPALQPDTQTAANVSAMLDAALGGGGGSAASGNNHNNNENDASSTNTGKRGVEDMLASLIPGLGHHVADASSSSTSKRIRTDGDGTTSSSSHYESTKKIWIPVDNNPGYNYVGLLIGPGGSKQRELVASSGGNVKISIRGKGSHSKGGGDSQASSGSGEEEPLHVLLEGKQENVDQAEKLIRELLEDSEAADKEKARQLGSMNPDGGSESGSTTKVLVGYTPKPVAQILGLGGGGVGTTTTMAGSTALSAYGPDSSGTTSTTQVEEKIGIPNGVVGFIIGKGGESIASMQRRTGCRVQIQKEHEMPPGSAQRVITLTAATTESIAECRAIIESMVRERMLANATTSSSSASASAATMMSSMGLASTGPGYNASSQMVQLQKALSEGHFHVTVQVPDADVGLIIGKGGMQIRNIQEKSGANIQIPQVADMNNPLVRTVNITHPNKEGGEFAKQMIEEILASKVMNTNNASIMGGGGAGAIGGMGGGVGDVTIQVNCPDKDVGMIIGRGGCVIKQMQTQTRCRIQIPPTAPPGSMYRIISIIGNPTGCQQVKQMIETIVAEQSSQSVMSGVAFSNNTAYGQQPQQQNYYGQQQSMYGQQQAYGQAAYGQQMYGQQQPTMVGQKTDYSAEWAAYYAAQAAAGAGGASVTTTAAAVTASTPAPAPAAAAGEQPAHDAYYEVFWQYAAYYGEDAARAHYGAWSPPVGTPNPNATATAAAPAAVSSSSSAVAVPTEVPNAQDSSVRKVSNLPAWMTQQQQQQQ